MSYGDPPAITTSQLSATTITISTGLSLRLRSNIFRSAYFSAHRGDLAVSSLLSSRIDSCCCGITSSRSALPPGTTDTSLLAPHDTRRMRAAGGHSLRLSNPNPIDISVRADVPLAYASSAGDQAALRNADIRHETLNLGELK